MLSIKNENVQKNNAAIHYKFFEELFAVKSNFKDH